MTVGYAHASGNSINVNSVQRFFGTDTPYGGEPDFTDCALDPGTVGGVELSSLFTDGDATYALNDSDGNPIDETYELHSSNLDAVSAGSSSNPGYVATANSDGTVTFQPAGGGGITLGPNIENGISHLASISDGVLDLSNPPSVYPHDFSPTLLCTSGDGSGLSGTAYGFTAGQAIEDGSGNVIATTYLSSADTDGVNVNAFFGGHPDWTACEIEGMYLEIDYNAVTINKPSSVDGLGITDGSVIDSVGLTDPSVIPYMQEPIDASGGLIDYATALGLFARLNYDGSFSTTASSQTSFTVTIGVTMADNTYKCLITPTSLLAVGGYVSAKTTTTFTVTYPSALTGALSFDWLVAP